MNLITQEQALRRALWWNGAALVAVFAVAFITGWLLIVLAVVALWTFHLAGYWYGWARAMRVGGHREMFAAGDGVFIQIIGPRITDEARTQILEALGEIGEVGPVERYGPPEES